MLKNNLYVYGKENVLKIPAEIHYGRHMLSRFMKFKNNVAIIEAATGKSITFGGLAQTAVDIALSLTHMGVRKGEVVGICSEQRLEYMPVMFGVICAGAAFTAIDTSGVATIKHRLNMVNPTLLFCSPSVFTTHGKLLQAEGRNLVVFGNPGACKETPQFVTFKEFLTHHAEVEEFQATPVQGWKDYAAILYSSGTTGLPKGVPMTHLNLLVHMLTKIDESYYTGQKVVTASEYYTYNISCLHAGATTIYTKKDAAKDVFEAIQKYKPKIIQQMPSVIFEMVHSPLIDNYDLSCLERILSASSPLRANLISAVRKRFPNLKTICQIYGATELGVLCSDEKAPKGIKAGSVGVTSDGLVMKVVDITTRKPVGANQRGEICVKSPSLFPGYLGDVTFAHLDGEGFYKTGDVGYYDEDKYFFIVDRIKDLIKYHGFPVAPAELEAVLAKHPDVRQAAVVGAPDEKYHELPTAFVVKAPGSFVTEDELTQFVNKQVAEWMPLAGGVRFIESIPRGTRGKIDRKALRLMLF